MKPACIARGGSIDELNNLLYELNEKQEKLEKRIALIPPEPMQQLNLQTSGRGWRFFSPRISDGRRNL